MTKFIHRSAKFSQRGFTLVELLVVIAIIGILVALLLPAIQAAREAARRNQCKNHLKQLALSCLLHEDTQKALPSGGWSSVFTADPNLGFGPGQPGSWYYNILPYVEEASARDLGKGVALASLQQFSIKLHQTPITIFNCPSRRAAKLYPSNWGTMYEQSWLGVAGFPVVKGDYAANTGDARNSAGTGFNGVNFTWPSTSAGGKTYTGWTRTNRATDAFFQTGVIYYRSEVASKKIVDGTSKTYLIGEKYLDVSLYEDAPTSGFLERYGDNQGIYAGFEWDNHRVAYKFPNTDGPGTPGSSSPQETYQPRQDGKIGVDGPSYLAFGSAHAGSMNMAMCDGSVQGVSYDVDPATHTALANRLDGKTGSAE